MPFPFPAKGLTRPSRPTRSSLWYDRLKAGQDDAAGALSKRYFPRLVGLARSKLAGLRRKASADEEDAALSAFDNFCRRAQGGGFAEVGDHDELWRVLSTVTVRKAARRVSAIRTA